MKTLRNFLIILTGLLAVLPLFAGSRRDEARAATDERMSNYLYLEAVAAENEGREADSYMLLKRASELDPSNIYIATERALTEIASRWENAPAVDSVLELLKARFEAQPSEELYLMAYVRPLLRVSRINEALDAYALVDSLYPSRSEYKRMMASLHAMRAAGGDHPEDALAFKAIYSELIAARPGNVALYEDFVPMLVNLGDTAEAVTRINALAAEAPADIKALLAASRMFSNLNMLDEADALIARATEIDPEDGDLRYARAAMADIRGDSIAFDREVFSALKSNNLDFETKYGLLMGYVRQLYSDTLQRDRIVQMFEALGQTNPGESRMHALYAAYLATIHDMPGAVEQQSYAVDLEPESPEYTGNLLQMMSMAGDSIAAAEASRLAVERFPGNFHIGIAAALLAFSDTVTALEYLKQVDLSTAVTDEGAPEEARLSLYYELRGNLYSALDSVPQALDDYERAININPDDFMAMNNAAYMLAERNCELNKAKLYASMAVNAQPDNSTFLDTYAWVLFKLKDFSSALEYMIRAVHSEMSTAAEPLDLDYEETDGNDEDITMTVIEIVDTEDEGEPISLGEILDRATDEQLKAVDAIYLEHLGDIYYFNSDPDRALRYWRLALELNPDNEAYRERVRRRAVDPDFTPKSCR